MFTGIVQAVGRVRRMQGGRLEVSVPAALLKPLRRGDSIAVNGCCLTVVTRGQGRSNDWFGADLTPETLERTNLGRLAPGARVNLETPLRAGDLLSGHQMQGHVEATGILLSFDPTTGDSGWWMRVKLPRALVRYCVPKGTLAVDGISLTIAGLRGSIARFAIIPYTGRHTNLRWLSPGAALNLETDPIARHLEQLMAHRRRGGRVS